MASDIITLENVTKNFGQVVAVNGVSVTFSSGECVGLVGHNGAGKSTLIHLITGILSPNEGGIDVTGALRNLAPRHSAGIRCVQQELSLCTNLNVAENMRILFPQLRGIGWRSKAAAAMARSLDEVFPGHGIDTATPVGHLPISQRQQVEIARAFAVLDEEPTLVILDEPTSALDRSTSEQLFAYVTRFVANHGSVILVTHKMDEVFKATQRIVVMRDGRKVSEGAASDFSFEKLVSTMGHTVVEQADRQRHLKELDRAEIRVKTLDAAGATLAVHKGEIVGLAGLAGHGQSELIRKIFAECGGGRAPGGQRPQVALVAGDRQSDGLLPVWSIRQNISVSSLAVLATKLGINLGSERDLAQRWCDRLQIKCTSTEDPIMSLSGGGQQKVLFARALASDADLILMDDPMRGVDFGTKRDVYQLIHEESRKGRAFVWYTTEFDELLECDRTYVLRDHRISGEIPRDRISEEEILAHSFAQ